jgi:twitching motility protein PilT
MDIHQLFRRAIEQGASDLLLTAGASPVMRIDGELRVQDSGPIQDQKIREMVFSHLSEEQIRQLERQRELDFAVDLDRGYRFRGNVFFSRRGIGANYRLLMNRIPTLEELYLPETLEEIAMERQGLVLITGPTGHGKSTTLASMIDIINHRKRAHVVTIEDPIEYIHENRLGVVDQREVGSDTLTFAGALRHVLRQSPDVILIGEMRDLETISAAITAAETGHLVLSTLHTNDVAQAVDRLIDVFPPYQQAQIRIQLSLCLLAVLGQRLLPRKDGRGRVVATELLRRTHAVAQMIREGHTHQIYTVLETQSRIGMHTMDNSIKNLYTKGLISLETALQHIRDPRLLGVITE